MINLIDHNNSVELVLLLLPEQLKLILPIQESRVCCCFKSFGMSHQSLGTPVLTMTILPSTVLLLTFQRRTAFGITL